jgi:hypothetical protein
MVKKDDYEMKSSMSGPIHSITPDILLHFYEQCTVFDTSEEIMFLQ